MDALTPEERAWMRKIVNLEDSPLALASLVDSYHVPTTTRKRPTALVPTDDGLTPADGPWGNSGVAMPGGAWTFNTSTEPENPREVLLSDILEPDAPDRYSLKPVEIGNMIRRLRKYGKHGLPLEVMEGHVAEDMAADPPCCPACGSTYFRDTDGVRHCSPCKTVIRKL